MRNAHGQKSRTGQALVVLQVAFSLLLVMAAGMFVQTLANVQRQRLGFDPQNILLFDIRPPQARYSGQRGQRLLQDIEQKLRAIPGVLSVGLSEAPLIAGAMSNKLFYHPGEKRSFDSGHSGYYNPVDAGFFSTMRIPLLAGRFFNTHDETENEQATVVNMAFVHKFFRNTGALGRVLETGPGEPVVRIVGICADAQYFDVKSEMPPTAYLFHLRQKDSNGATFEIRTNLKTGQIAGAVRSAVRAVDQDLPVIAMRTQQEQIDFTRVDERLFATLASSFAFLALAIASVGVYGLMAFSVASRTNEIGIRMALGARARQVLGMVLRETTVLTFAGVVIGVAAAIALARFVRSMLFGLQPGDPATLIGATLILLMAALAAAYLPARRAARVDPMQALRHD